MSKHYRNNDNGGSRKKNSFINIAIIVVCAVLAGSALLASVGFLSKGFTNTDVTSWFEKELNPDNLIKKADYMSKLDDKLDNGLKLDWKDDGRVVLSGKVEDDTKTGDQMPDPYAFVSVTLDAGEVYMISTGNNLCSEKTFGLYVEYNDSTGAAADPVFVGGDAVKLDFSEYTEPVTLTISIFYENDHYYFPLTSVIKPTLVKGETAGEFYK